MSVFVKDGGTVINNWGKFAEMLGLEIGQKFVLTKPDGKRKDLYTYEITEEGIFYKSRISCEWLRDEMGLVEELLNGCIKAVPKPWKPKKGGTYWFFSCSLKQKMSSKWGDGTYDLILWNAGNCFRTKEEAETKGKEIMEQIQKEYEEA